MNKLYKKRGELHKFAAVAPHGVHTTTTTTHSEAARGNSKVAGPKMAFHTSYRTPSLSQPRGSSRPGVAVLEGIALQQSLTLVT